MDSQALAQEWIDLKEQERKIVERRREVEDALIAYHKVNESLNMTYNLKIQGYKAKVVGRLSQKVDTDLLQELAAEAGVTHLLSDLFRWKAEVNKKKWDELDQKISNALSGAITTTPSRPSFSITVEK